MLRFLFSLVIFAGFNQFLGAQAFEASCNLIKKKSFCIQYYSEHPSRAKINERSCERKNGKLNIAGSCPNKKLIGTCTLKRDGSPGRNYYVKTFYYKSGKSKFSPSTAKAMCDKTYGVKVQFGKELTYKYDGPEPKVKKDRKKKKKKRKKKKRKKRKKKKRKKK